MNDPVRSRIRADIMATYEEPSADLARRALSVLPVRAPRRSALQIVAVTAALLVIAGLVLIARGTHLLPLLQEGSHAAGLRPPVAPYSIVDNQFVSANTGWILIQMHVTSGPLVLLKTSDGGAHWVEQFRFSGQGGIDDIQFAQNGRDGWMTWIVGGATLVSPGTPIPAANATHRKTYVTHDGGNHWVVARDTYEPNPPKTAPRPEYLPGQSFYLPNGVEGWQLLTPSSLKGSAVVMHTTDGGTSWTHVGTIPAAAAENGQLSFADSRTGWLSVSANQTFAWDGQGRRLPSNTPPALLYLTRDGGATWSTPQLALPAAASSPSMVTGLGQPVMFDAKHGLLPLQLNPAPARPNGATPRTPGQAPASFVLKTSDGGDHWANLTQVSGAASDGALLFLSVDHWLTTKGGLLSETTDGGRSWSTHRVLADGLELSLAQWDYIKPSVIWAQVGAGSLVRSIDGGKTWTAVTPPQVH